MELETVASEVAHRILLADTPPDPGSGRIYIGPGFRAVNDLIEMTKQLALDESIFWEKQQAA